MQRQAPGLAGGRHRVESKEGRAAAELHKHQAASPAELRASSAPPSSSHADLVAPPALLMPDPATAQDLIRAAEVAREGARDGADPVAAAIGGSSGRRGRREEGGGGAALTNSPEWERRGEIGVVISPTFNAKPSYQYLQPTKHKLDNTCLLLATQLNIDELY